MPFPFLWTGALVAVALLSTIFAIFGLLAHLLDSDGRPSCGGRSCPD